MIVDVASIIHGIIVNICNCTFVRVPLGLQAPKLLLRHSTDIRK